MRKSGKSKVEETPAKAKLSEESENGEGDEERPVSPASSKSTRRIKKASSVDGARNKRKKRDDDEDDEEAVEKAEEKSDESDDEKIPLSKKMKAVKRTPAKNGVAKGKKRAAELEVKEEYEVESVVGSRLLRGKRQFRIHWKGFNEEDDTWEAEEGLDCTEAIQQYLSTHPEEETDAGPKTIRSKKVVKKTTKKNDKDTEGEDGDKSDEEEASKEEFEVDRIMDMFIKRKEGKREFLIRWKGYSSKEDTWEPEEHLNCGDLIEKYLVKVNAAKSSSEKELRVSRKPTERFTLTMAGSGRRISRRGQGKQRARYDDAE